MRVRPSTLFLYGLIITLLVLMTRDIKILLLIVVINTPVGIFLGIRRRLGLFLALFFIGLIGVFINSFFIGNTGRVIYSFYGIVFREGFIRAFTAITLRLLAILGVALIFTSIVNTREFIRSLENELHLPTGIAFATSIGIRMLDIVSRDAREIRHIRIMRGMSRYPITPSSLLGYLRPLLSMGLERARWIGIAAEMRGLGRRKRVKIKVGYSIIDYLVWILLLIQVSAVASILLNIL